MTVWATFWGGVLLLAILVFIGVAVGVAIQGFFDVKTLFEQIDRQHEQNR